MSQKSISKLVKNIYIYLIKYIAIKQSGLYFLACLFYFVFEISGEKPCFLRENRVQYKCIFIENIAPKRLIIANKYEESK